MVSPFPPSAVNALVRFKVPTGEKVVDSLGNPASVTVETEFRCYFKLGSGRRQEQLGGDLTQAAIRGYMVDPMTLPPSVLPGTQGKITFYSDPGTLQNVAAEGDFILEPRIPKAFGVDDLVGHSISGIFVARVAWGDNL